MPHVAKRARRNDLSVELTCEWGACQETFCGMQEFCLHVEEHLKVLTPFDTTEDVEDFVCLWRDCGSIPDSEEELQRHIFFHCHHTKLKQWGLAVLKTQANLGTCAVGQHNRNIVPPTTDRFTCLWEHCGVSMVNAEWYYRHVDNHAQSLNISSTEKQEKEFRCEWTDCKATFKGQFRLREHLRSHTQEKIAACPFCGAMFANNTKLIDHIRRQNTIDDQKFQCTLCLKCFAFEKLLRDHMRNHVRTHKCTLCDMTCSSPSAVRNHMRFRHSTERPYSCDMCQYSCKNKIDLQKHVDTHNQEPVYQCDYDDCNFATRVMETLQGHYRKAHLQKDPAPRFLCHICEQSFGRGNYLTIHLRKKHQWKSHSRLRYIKHADGFMRLLVSHSEATGLTRLSGEGCNADQRSQGEFTQPGCESETSGCPSSLCGPGRSVKRKLGADGGNTHQPAQEEDSQPVWGDGTSEHQDPVWAKSESGTVLDQPADGTIQEYLAEVCHALMQEDSVDKLALEEEDMFGQLSIVVPLQCNESLDAL